MTAILAAKLELEAALAAPLQRVVAHYINVWQHQQGVIPFWDRVNAQTRIEAVLLAHYGRVVGTMLGTEHTIEAGAVNMRHAESLRSRAHAHAVYYLNVTDQDLIAIMRGTHPAHVTIDGAKSLDLIETKQDAPTTDTPKPSGFSVSYVGRFKATAQQAWAKLKAKVGKWANVETEEPAEEALFEFVKDRKAANTHIVKVWSSLMDGRERPTHHAAHGQEVGVEEAFEVGGSRLRFPGDTSLGASLKEIISCRCSAEYVAVGPNGERVPLLSTERGTTRRSHRPGDRFGKETPITPTTLVTLNGNTRARIVLGDGATIASMNQVTPSTINIIVNRRTIARAAHRNGDVTAITIDPRFAKQGIEDLIKRSVAHSWTRSQR